MPYTVQEATAAFNAYATDIETDPLRVAREAADRAERLATVAENHKWLAAPAVRAIRALLADARKCRLYSDYAGPDATRCHAALKRALEAAR